MRVLCDHGFYRFYPDDNGSLARFSHLFAIDLEKERDYYTFSYLKGLKDYSLAGSFYSTGLATKTFEGYPWEIMRANGLVFNFSTGLLVPKIAIINSEKLIPANQFFLCGSRLLQAGSRDQSANQILSYDSDFDFDINKQRIRWVSYE